MDFLDRCHQWEWWMFLLVCHPRTRLVQKYWITFGESRVTYHLTAYPRTLQYSNQINVNEDKMCLPKSWAIKSISQLIIITIYLIRKWLSDYHYHFHKSDFWLFIGDSLIILLLWLFLMYVLNYSLAHWDRVMHIYVSKKQTLVGQDNGLPLIGATLFSELTITMTS